MPRPRIRETVPVDELAQPGANSDFSDRPKAFPAADTTKGV